MRDNKSPAFLRAPEWFDPHASRFWGGHFLPGVCNAQECSKEGHPLLARINPCVKELVFHTRVNQAALPRAAAGQEDSNSSAGESRAHFCPETQAVS